MGTSIKAITAASLFVLLAACGGGGDKSGTSPNEVASGGNGSGTGTGSTPPSSNSAVDTTARFNNPTHLAIDSAGNIFVSDEGNQLIRKISRTGEVSSLPADTLYQSTQPVRSRNTKLAIDPFDNLFILSPSMTTDHLGIPRPAYVVYKLAPNEVKTVVASYMPDPYLKSYHARSIATDALGRLYVLSNRDQEHVIGRIDPDGSLHSVLAYSRYSSIYTGHLEQFTSSPHGDIALITGDLTQESPGGKINYLLNVPQSVQPVTARVEGITDRIVSHSSNWFGWFDVIIYERNGDIYTADVRQDDERAFTAIRIMKITPDGKTTTIYEGFPDGSTASRPWSPLFREPIGMVRAANGDFYISDPYLHAIYKITPSGQASLFAGKPGEPGVAD